MAAHGNTRAFGAEIALIKRRPCLRNRNRLIAVGAGASGRPTESPKGRLRAFLSPNCLGPARPRAGPIAMSPYDRDLDKNPANFQPLSPLTFLERSARLFPDRTAVIDGACRFTYRDFYARARRLASTLARRGIGRGDTVAVMLANTLPMLEADGRRRAQRAQHAPRPGHRRLLARPRRGQGAHRRP